MKDITQVKQEIQGILDGHNANLRGMYELHNTKVSKARNGVQEGKYQPSYLSKVLDNAKLDMISMYQGYREELLQDLTNYRNEVNKEIRKAPKDTDYQKAMYNLQYLKSIEPKEGNYTSQEIYNKEVYRIALETPHLADNVLNVADKVSEVTKQEIQTKTDILLGNDLVLYLDDAIAEVKSTISARREEDGCFTIKNSISVGTDIPQANTFDILSFDKQ
ncbi:Uncharacterised protein [uncultured Clostridium sp.]|nr:Uncharacterised protein [uncultured Clostridium sp.]